MHLISGIVYNPFNSNNLAAFHFVPAIPFHSVPFHAPSSFLIPFALLLASVLFSRVPFGGCVCAGGGEGGRCEKSVACSRAKREMNTQGCGEAKGPKVRRRTGGGGGGGETTTAA